MAECTEVQLQQDLEVAMSHPIASTPVSPVRSLFARPRQNSRLCWLILPTVIALVVFLCVLATANASAETIALEQPIRKAHLVPLAANAV